MRLKCILRELVHPSDHAIVRRIRRVIHRALVAILSSATLLAVAAWAVSFTVLRQDYTKQFDQRTLYVRSIAGQDGIAAKFEGERGDLFPVLVIGASAGQGVLCYTSHVAKGTIVPTRRVELGGFRWAQHVDYSRTKVTLFIFPCWAPIFLFSAWPIIAFLRGPFRRAARRAKGFCLKCGYNLTGLVKPRCPEFGTPTKPGQVSAPRTRGNVPAPLDDLP